MRDRSSIVGLNRKQTDLETSSFSGFRLFLVTGPKNVEAGEQAQASRGRHVQEIRTSRKKFGCSPSTELIGGFQERVALQLRLPAQTDLGALGGTERLPGNLTIRIAA